MEQKKDKDTYQVTWSEDDNEYVGLCAGFPIWISKFELAGTPEKALKGGQKSGVSLNRIADSKLNQ
jgi:hypothetical protein